MYLPSCTPSIQFRIWSIVGTQHIYVKWTDEWMIAQGPAPCGEGSQNPSCFISHLSSSDSFLRCARVLHGTLWLEPSLSPTKKEGNNPRLLGCLELLLELGLVLWPPKKWPRYSDDPFPCPNTSWQWFYHDPPCKEGKETELGSQKRERKVWGRFGVTSREISTEKPRLYWPKQKWVGLVARTREEVAKVGQLENFLFS